MTAQALEHYLYPLDDAFAGPDWHSLLSNLHTVAPEDWTWVLPGGVRSIRAIVRHVGRGKLMAYDQAFGAGTRTSDEVGGDEETGDIRSGITWLRASPGCAHHLVADGPRAPARRRCRPRRRRRAAAAAADELGRAARDPLDYRRTMIQHDIFHAGEINHLRSQHQSADQWE